MIGSNNKKDEGPGVLAAALQAAGVTSGEFPATRPPVDGQKKKARQPSPQPSALRVVKDDPTPAAPPAPPVVDSSPVMETTPPVPPTPAPTATSGLSFEDLAALGAIKALPEGTEVRLPSGVTARRTATANDEVDTLTLLNPFADTQGRQAMVKAGEAVRKRREEDEKRRRDREQAARIEQEKRARHTREVLGAKLPEMIGTRKGGKPIADFRKDGKLDMGKLATALGDRCAITDRAQRPGGGIILLIGEWGWMVDSGFDRDTAISMAKDLERKMRQAAAEEAEQEKMAALVEAIRASGHLIQHSVKQDGGAFVALPVSNKSGAPRLVWGKVKEVLSGTPDPLTGERVERPGAFLLSFPEDKEGEEAIKAAGLRLLSGFSRRLLATHPDLLPTGMQSVAVDALSEHVNLLLDATLPLVDETGRKGGPSPAARAKKAARAELDRQERERRRGPSHEVAMRPLTREERRAQAAPEKPITRRQGGRRK